MVIFPSHSFNIIHVWPLKEGKKAAPCTRQGKAGVAAVDVVGDCCTNGHASRKRDCRYEQHNSPLSTDSLLCARGGLFRAEKSGPNGGGVKQGRTKLLQEQFFQSGSGKL
jgi:hypothetical protein